MDIVSKLLGRKKEEEATKVSVEEFVSLVKVYFQSVMAVNLGITNVNFVPDMALFKRMLKITTQNNKLGVAEKSRVRKVLMQDYGLDESFFREIDASIKKNCKSQNDIQSYYIVFQGFSNDLFTLIGNLMQWKMQIPSILKKLLRSMTRKVVHNIVVKTDWKDESVRATTRNIRKYKEKLGYSEEWMTEFVYHVVLLAKKEKRNSQKK